MGQQLPPDGAGHYVFWDSLEAAEAARERWAQRIEVLERETSLMRERWPHFRPQVGDRVVVLVGNPGVVTREMFVALAVENWLLVEDVSSVGFGSDPPTRFFWMEESRVLVVERGGRHEIEPGPWLTADGTPVDDLKKGES